MAACPSSRGALRSAHGGCLGRSSELADKGRSSDGTRGVDPWPAPGGTRGEELFAVEKYENVRAQTGNYSRLLRRRNGRRYAHDDGRRHDGHWHGRCRAFLEGGLECCVRFSLR